MIEAMRKRCSRRSYKKEPLCVEDITFLEEKIQNYNTAAGLHMQLVTNNEEAFHGLKKSYGMFHNVCNYIALVGDNKDVYIQEKLGYFGEKLVLEATQRELGTCWVGGTYDADSCPIILLPHEKLYCVIAIGYVNKEKSFKEKAIAKVAHRKSKTIQQMSNATRHTPAWFTNGLKAVQVAPSALFKQPVYFTYENDKVFAKIDKPETHEMLDLGIALLHFELGAEQGQWIWGNPAIYNNIK